ncbi:hypothetical protein [uncultured Dokdonia sp.]|uniref:hypothetical protein n=1 Tax=uncultured Dokdonia sp. TaxID=575653 RepID=UPI00261246DB|nr:hypothetical protein [uncultured Dokdonia sp.]
MAILKGNKISEVEELIQLVFEKAAKDSKETQAYGLSQYLSEKLKEPIAERTLTRYYDGYVLDKKSERKKPTKANLDILSCYVGYTDYKDFLSKKNVITKVDSFKTKIVASVVLNILLIGVLSFFTITYYKKNCMIWVGDHYEKIRCSGIENEERLDPIRLKKLRKIMVCRDTVFFKNGKARIWYDKTNNVRTYFSHYGINPENGESLHEITQPIIDNHVPKCK